MGVEADRSFSAILAYVYLKEITLTSMPKEWRSQPDSQVIDEVEFVTFSNMR
jgi:hypothetical protein